MGKNSILNKLNVDIPEDGDLLNDLDIEFQMEEGFEKKDIKKPKKVNMHKSNTIDKASGFLVEKVKPKSKNMIKDLINNQELIEGLKSKIDYGYIPTGGMDELGTIEIAAEHHYTKAESDAKYQPIGGSSSARTISLISSDYTLTSADDVLICSGTDIVINTIDLVGYAYDIKNIGSDDVVVSGTNIDGETSQTISQYTNMHVILSGDRQFIL